MLYFKLFYIFFYIGLFSFGGGYAMLPLIYQAIQNFHIMSAHEFSNVVALSQMTPGPIAVNAATYVGFKSAGFWGAAFATLGVSLPSFLLILTIAAFFNKFKTSPVIQAVLTGIRPATVGMIATAVLFFWNTAIFREGFFSMNMVHNPLHYLNIPGLIIFGLTIAGAKYGRMGPITLTIIGGVLGAILL